VSKLEKDFLSTVMTEQCLPTSNNAMVDANIANELVTHTFTDPYGNTGNKDD
jgi:hypothetical protein